LAAGVVLAAALALAAVVHEHRVTASSCAPPKLIRLQLVSVTADGVPAAGNYDANVRLFNRGPGVVEISALPTGARTAFYSETYRAANAPAP
jgi:hypothetical protein